MSLRDATRSSPTGTGQARSMMDPAWSNGHGMFGGYLTATLLSAVLARAEPPNAVLSVAATFAGRARPRDHGTITVTKDHHGRIVACWNARLMVDERLIATAQITSVAASTNELDGPLATDHSADLTHGELIVSPPHVPSLGQFEFHRVLRGGVPVPGTVWVRLADRWWAPSDPWPAIGMIATLDLTFPGRDIDSLAGLVAGGYQTVQFTGVITAPVTTSWARIQLRTVVRRGPVVVVRGEMSDADGRICATTEQVALAGREPAGRDS